MPDWMQLLLNSDLLKRALEPKEPVYDTSGTIRRALESSSAPRPSGKYTGMPGTRHEFELNYSIPYEEWARILLGRQSPDHPSAGLFIRDFPNDVMRERVSEWGKKDRGK